MEKPKAEVAESATASYWNLPSEQETLSIMDTSLLEHEPIVEVESVPPSSSKEPPHASPLLQVKRKR
jgi:hypothetical protein